MSEEEPPDRTKRDAPAKEEHWRWGARETTTESESELDISSNEFNALRALYASDYRVSNKEPKVQYQNLAAFESALKRVGIWKLNKRKEKETKTTGEGSSSVSGKQQDDDDEQQPCSSKTARHIVMEEDAATQRRFLPHQMAVRGTGARRPRHQRNLFRQMEKAVGPLALLYKWVKERIRVRVQVRKEHGVRGWVEGRLLCFDKHWNLLLRDVTETWQRRKYKYSDNRCCGVPQDCAQQLRALGITWPEQRVKSLNRKNVEISRQLPQLLLRGEQVVLVSEACKTPSE